MKCNTNHKAVDVNHPCRYEDLTQKEKDVLRGWIRQHYEKSKRTYWQRSSYGLKHDFERDTRVYVDNGTFKGAMLAEGFSPAGQGELNWHFKMKEKVPNDFHGWCVQRYKHRDSSLGDLARDMQMDPQFPRKSMNKGEIRGYIESRSASENVIRAFERAWKQYERFRAKNEKALGK